MKLKAIIFDLDGTLINTLEDLQGSVNAALAPFSMPPRTLDEVRTRVGNGIFKLIERAVPEGTDEQTVQAVFAAFRADYAVRYKDKSTPYDGITELLRELKRCGIRTAVVSNKADPMAKGLCEDRFGDLLDAVFGESETMPKKPAPQMVCAALDALDVTKEETLYVGDSEVDHRTAINAGVRSVSVLWGFRSEDDLRAVGASEFVTAPEDLLAYFEG